MHQVPMSIPPTHPAFIIAEFSLPATFHLLQGLSAIKAVTALCLDRMAFTVRLYRIHRHTYGLGNLYISQALFP